MKVVGMLSVFNDEDIIEEVIEHMISQGLELVILDNGSTDRTLQLCEKFLDKGLLKLEQYKTATFPWSIILRKLYDMAIFESPDWIVRSDSDQFLESGMNGVTLTKGITQADAEGFNIIQFDRFDFFMTDDNNESAKSIKEKLTYYSFQNDFAYRAWKYVSGIHVSGLGFGGHCPIFPEGGLYKIYPKKFVLRNYQLRSKEQAKRKIEERLSSTANQIFNSQKITHLENILQSDYSSPLDHHRLQKYNEDNQWDYEKKYSPFIVKQPSREELFTNDGLLRVYQVKNKLKETGKKLDDAKLKISDLEKTIQSLKEKPES